MNTEHGGALITLAAMGERLLVDVEATINGDVESVLLHRDGDVVRAWLNVCPHAGRRLDWAPGEFLVSKDGHLVCAAHGASFELQRGDCIAGPCRGESLRAVAVEVRDGTVFLSASDGKASAATDGADEGG